MNAPRFIALVIVLLLTGCAYTYLPPPGKTVQEIKRDNWECKREVLQATQLYIGLGGFAAQDELIRECMEVRGYTVPEDEIWKPFDGEEPKRGDERYPSAK